MAQMFFEQQPYAETYAMYKNMNIGKKNNCERRIFIDENQFSLDGSDHWKSYMQKTMTN